MGGGVAGLLSLFEWMTLMLFSVKNEGFAVFEQTSRTATISP